MEPPSSFLEDDRVLFLSPPGDVLDGVAATLKAGLVVVLGSDEEVSELRRKHAHLDNVMFVTASAEDIPWQDGFFTHVLDPAGRWVDSSQAAREAARVLVSDDR